MPRSLALNVQPASSNATVTATFSSFFSAAYFTRPVASSGVMPLTSTPISFTPSRNVFFVLMMASISVGILSVSSRLASQMMQMMPARPTAAARSTCSIRLRCCAFLRLFSQVVPPRFFAEAAVGFVVLAALWVVFELFVPRF